MASLPKGSRSLKVGARLSRATLSAAMGMLVIGACSLVIGCGQCLLRVKVNNDPYKCVINTCPKNSEWTEGVNRCGCKANFVVLGGACVTVAEANASCPRGYVFNRGACVAPTCPPHQILNTQSMQCEDKAQKDVVVAQNAGIKLEQGKQLGCPPGQTYVVNGNDGACIPNEATCGTGTKWEPAQNKCVAIATECPAGEVYDAAQAKCVKLTATQDQQKFSVQTKLTAALGPDFCAPHAKNPGAFNVAPGQTLNVKIEVTVAMPDNEIEKVQLASLKVTNNGGPDLPASMTGVQNIQKQVNDQILTGIKALGGKSQEAQATHAIVCKISRSPIQVIDTTGGGV